MSQSPQQGSVFRIFQAGLLKVLYRFFIVFALKFDVSQIIIGLKIIRFYGLGRDKRLVRFVKQIELCGGYTAALGNEKFIQCGTGGDKPGEDFLGFISLFPVLILEVNLPHRQKGIGIPGILGKFFGGVFGNRITAF
jgi:hypothetical protein